MRTIRLVLSVPIVCISLGCTAMNDGSPVAGRDARSIEADLDRLAEQGGGTLQLPAGTFRLDEPIVVPEGVILAGAYNAPHHAQLKRGTVFEVYAGKGEEDAAPLVSLSPSSAVRGITFFYPEQRVPDVIPYPWTVQGRGMHGTVADCTFVNSYKAIDFGTHHHELHYIANCHGCPLKAGIRIDQCTDIGRIENVHFNPHYWFRAGAPNDPDGNALIQYLSDHLVGFEFGRTDWQSVLNTFCFGAKVGYHFVNSGHGATNGSFLGIGADWARRALLVEDCQPIGLLITNGEFVGREDTDAMIEIRPTNAGLVSLSNCSFWGPCPTAAIVDGQGAVSFSQCQFLTYPKTPSDAYMIEARGGDLTVQACRFSMDRPDIRLGPGITSAAIFGNRFRKHIEIVSESSGQIEQSLNVTSAPPRH